MALPTMHELREWHLRSHLAARRNALAASTELASRRRERAEVEKFMQAYLERRARPRRTDEEPGARGLPDSF